MGLQTAFLLNVSTTSVRRSWSGRALWADAGFAKPNCSLETIQNILPARSHALALYLQKVYGNAEGLIAWRWEHADV